MVWSATSEVGVNDSVLEVGCGPGVVIQRFSTLAPAGRVAGIDQSRKMVEQARARNATAIQSGPKRSCRPAPRFRGEPPIR